MILKATVHDFRSHHLKERVFKLMKIGCLNIKKAKILNQVAYEFREDRIYSRTAFLNNGQSIETQKNYDDPREQRVLLQKCYTAWLQFALESFIKNKVLHRFVAYSKSRLLANTFRAWRDVAWQAERTPAGRGYNLPKTPSDVFVDSSLKRPVSILKNS